MPTITLGTVTINKSSHSYIKQILATKRLSYGPFSEKFEQLFAQTHQVKHAVLCNSGTSALQIILAVAKNKYGWKNGDEILVPAITFVATINAIVNSGLKPVLVDVDPRSYNLDPQLIEDKISRKTRAIMPVHLFGSPAAMDEISQLCKRHNLKLFEDSCEAIAVDYQGKSVGSWGEAAAFSLHSAHILAAGIGGVITTNNSELAQRFRSLIYHGRDISYLSIDDDDQLSDSDLKKIIDKRFLFNKIGFSCRLSELEAAIALSQLEKINKIVGARSSNVHYLNQKLQDLSAFIQLPQLTKASRQPLMAYPLVIRKKLINSQPKLLQKLVLFLEKNKVETRYFFPLINQPAYRQFGWQPSNYPVASYLEKAGLYFGCHQDLVKNDLDYLSDLIHKFFHKKIKVNETE